MLKFTSNGFSYAMLHLGKSNLNIDYFFLDAKDNLLKIFWRR